METKVQTKTNFLLPYRDELLRQGSNTWQGPKDQLFLAQAGRMLLGFRLQRCNVPHFKTSFDVLSVSSEQLAPGCSPYNKEN